MLCAWCGVESVCMGMGVIVDERWGGCVGAWWLGLEIV